MKQLLTILAVGVVSLQGIAQDLHFSQVLQTPSLLNPGAVGVFDGWERAALHHRNQWLGGNTQFMSTAASAEVTFLKDHMRPKAHMAVGLLFFNDIGGSANFGVQTGALTLSGILPVGNASQLSVGIQGGFGSRKGNMSALMYESQWNGTAFDPTLASGEGDALNSFNYMDASAGIFYQYDGGKTNFARNNDVKFQAGFAAYHVNKPELRYRSGGTEQLARKYVLMMNFSRDIPNTKWAFDAQAVQFMQGGHFETIFGMIGRRRFKEGTKQTGFTQDASIGFGCYARLKDAFIPTVQLDFRGFRFGLSYDAMVSRLRKASGAGSVEVSISYTNKHHALFKRHRFYH